MSLPWAVRGLKIPYVVRNDRQSRGLAMAAATITAASMNQSSVLQDFQEIISTFSSTVIALRFYATA
jgi:hypothetical protein